MKNGYDTEKNRTNPYNNLTLFFIPIQYSISCRPFLLFHYLPGHSIVQFGDCRFGDGLFNFSDFFFRNTPTHTHTWTRPSVTPTGYVSELEIKFPPLTSINKAEPVWVGRVVANENTTRLERTKFQTVNKEIQIISY